MSIEVTGDGKVFFNGEEVAGVRASDIAGIHIGIGWEVGPSFADSIEAIKSNELEWVAKCSFVGGRGHIARAERKRRNKELKQIRERRKVNRKR